MVRCRFPRDVTVRLNGGGEEIGLTIEVNKDLKHPSRIMPPPDEHKGLNRPTAVI